MNNLKGKVAFVTGSASGIGRSCAIAREGCDLVIADLNVEAASVVVDEVKQLGQSAIALELDVSDVEKYDRCVQEVAVTSSIRRLYLGWQDVHSSKVGRRNCKALVPWGSWQVIQVIRPLLRGSVNRFSLASIRRGCSLRSL